MTELANVGLVSSLIAHPETELRCGDTSDVFLGTGVSSLAVFSANGLYRYALIRAWDEKKEKLCVIALNPSTATESVNDPTVVRCMARARQLGFGGLVMLNLFALRSPSPGDLRDNDQAGVDSIGPVNDVALKTLTAGAGMVLCGWGAHGSYRDRSAAVAGFLLAGNVPLHALRLTGAGEPGHPLYLPYHLKPFLWKQP